MITCPSCGLTSANDINGKCPVCFNDISGKVEKSNIIKEPGPIVKIQSDHRSQTIFYDVDIKLITCPCNQFKNNRSGYGLFDPRRLCKHLVKAYYETNSSPDTLEPVKSCIKYFYSKGSGHPMADYLDTGKINGKEIAVFYDAYNELEEQESPSWITIYYNENCYGYSFAIDTWAYSDDDEEMSDKNKASILHWLHKQGVFTEHEIDDYEEDGDEIDE